jgi:hypothetical protein
MTNPKRPPHLVGSIIIEPTTRRAEGRLVAVFDGTAALGSRAVACRAWHWLPGMRYWADSDRFGDLVFASRVSERKSQIDALNSCGEGERPVPDLSDPATRGCLLELVREAWGDDEAIASPRGTSRRWIVEIEVDGEPLEASEEGTAPEGSTEAEALVAALEAAPDHRDPSARACS